METFEQDSENIRVNKTGDYDMKKLQKTATLRTAHKLRKVFL